jgi:hypothetical protein
VDKRFPPRDGYDGGSTFINGAHAIIETQPFIEDFIGIINLAATGTGKVTPEQRFEHQYQGVTFDSFDLVDKQVFGNLVLLD